MICIKNEANEKERVGGQASVNNSHHPCSGVFLLQFSSFIVIRYVPLRSQVSTHADAMDSDFIDKLSKLSTCKCRGVRVWSVTASRIRRESHRTQCTFRLL